MISGMQKGQVAQARDYWDTHIAPIFNDMSAANDTARRDRLKTWAATHGPELLSVAEAAIQECERMYAMVRSLGGDQS